MDYSPVVERSTFTLLHAEQNTNGQGNAASQGSGGNAAPASASSSTPSGSNSANADQSNNVAGAEDGGNNPQTYNNGGITVEPNVLDGNAVNAGPVSSGNRKLFKAETQI